MGGWMMPKSSLAARLRPATPDFSGRGKALPLQQIPAIVWVVLAATSLAAIGGDFLGYHLSGWGWIIPFALSILILARYPGRVKFPLSIWLCWGVFLIVHLQLSGLPALQRTAQLLCPLIVGAAVSTLRLEARYLRKIHTLLAIFALVFFLISLAQMGVLTTGKLPTAGGLAAQVMIALVLCCFFAASDACGRGKDLGWWLLLAAIPVIALTRTAMAVAGLTLICTLGPLAMKKRLAVLLVGLVIAFGLFQTERLQRITFHSGSGDVEQMGSMDLNDSGRFFMWEQFTPMIMTRPLFGYGAGAGEEFTKHITDGRLVYPHNDWLLTAFDYGFIGSILFGFTLLAASWHAWRRSRLEQGEIKIFFLAGAGAFLPMALMMITDNIMVYASFFGNLHFMILGLAYAAAAHRKGPRPLPRQILRRRPVR